MSRGYPSMTALLGLLAIAGYQNREKIGEMLRSVTGGSSRAPGTGDQPQGQSGGLGGLLGGASIGSVLGDGLRDLVERFRQAGQGETADSWVAQGPNRDIAPDQLERAIGGDTLETLARHTGLSRDEILARLTRELPGAVDKYTPDGRLPADDGPQRSA
jgi:uncharacterized protein YidB (DUF937 family)